MDDIRIGHKTLHLKQSVSRIPDKRKVQRYLKSPELGPSLLFFSGGSALDNTSRCLKQYTHNSIHLITPFDSGGSSAKLRKAFNMPAVGDVRARLMALADDTALGHPEIFTLFKYRLPTDQPQEELKSTVKMMQSGKHRMVKSTLEPMRSLICDYLQSFLKAAPDDFDYRGASIGNLILTGGYLNHDRSLDPITFLFSKLVNVRGIVRTITDEDFELKATLSDGSCVVGQHNITAKETEPLNKKIVKLTLAEHQDTPESQASSRIRKQNKRLIKEADLLVFPPGSFYSSLVANLLPKGVGKSALTSAAPRVFIPNLGNDPELFDTDLREQIDALNKAICDDAGRDADHVMSIDIVLTDSALHKGITPAILDYIEVRGIQLLDIDLRNACYSEHYDEQKLIEALLSLT
jgi:CofD-related protein of GAK system